MDYPFGLPIPGVPLAEPKDPNVIVIIRPPKSLSKIGVEDTLKALRATGTLGEHEPFHTRSQDDGCIVVRRGAE